ncbi:MAG TPA: pyridoxamine 5'-phosphate oxidase family protein [Bacteroidales bacterium]|nr:pyridoxamine 5'-phosphate oxidase family protein [Bacteroidales bacterium]
MLNIPSQIINFIKKHHILTIATVNDNNLWCATCFYAFDFEKQQFIITTDLNTEHGKQMINNNQVVGTIALETKIVGKIQGIQFAANVAILQDENIKRARKIYFKKFPIALPFINQLILWSVTPNYIKFTDNKLGFGKKIIWP